MPIEIVWSPLARRRLQEIREYVAKDKPIAAERLPVRIVAATQALRKFPYLGRIGTDPATRELVIGNTPYVVVYKIQGGTVIVNTIWHGSQKRDA